LDELESRASTAERALAIEQSKKRRAKEMINKLRCELINRRWKEKYEVELLEQEERNWEIKVVEVECELAILRGELGCERAERGELEVSSNAILSTLCAHRETDVANSLQSIVATQKERISTLAASKQLLLESFNHSEKTISSLRTSLARTQSTVTERDEELKKCNEQVATLREELVEAGTKSGEGEARLREKNAKLKGEIEDLKVRLASPSLLVR
jgi:chromosome segregation ATPase